MSNTTSEPSIDFKTYFEEQAYPLSKASGEIDIEATEEMYREPFKYANETGSKPDYISYAYITIALMIGAFVAVKLYRGAKKRAKPFKVEVKASVSVSKPEDEKND